MNEKQNIELRQLLRSDHLQYGRELFLPEDLPQEIIDTEWGDSIKAGVIKKVTRTPTVPEDRVASGTKVTSRGVAKPAAGGAGVSMPAPASVQMMVMSVGASVSGNGVSPSRFGPCMIEHVQAFTYADGGATNQPQRFGVNISPSHNLGPFAGEIGVFEYYDPQDLFGIGQGAGQIFYKQRVDTAVGSRVYPLADFYPKLIVPWSTFYVNVSVGGVNHPATVFVTVEFGPLTMAKGATISRASYDDVRAPSVSRRAVAPAEPVAVARTRSRVTSARC